VTAASQPAPSAKPTAVELLEEAELFLQQSRSVSVGLRHTVDLFGHRLVGTGTYSELQDARTRFSRLELKIQLGQQTTSLVQVCDGEAIWTHRRLLDDGKLERVDLARVRAALRQAGRPLDDQPPSGAGHLCGLGRLLHGLGQRFEFAPPQPGLLGTEKLPVWRLTGRWKHEPDAAASNGPPDAVEKMPHIPDEVVLCLRQADRFPLSVRYLRGHGGQGRPLVSIQLDEPTFNAPIDPSQFTYAAGNSGEVDGTPDALRSLGLGDK